MTIRAYAYAYTLIGMSLLFTSNCFFCEVLLDKTITSFVRKTQKSESRSITAKFAYCKNIFSEAIVFLILYQKHCETVASPTVFGT